jgi:transposase
MDTRLRPHDPDSRHHDVASDEGAENWACIASLIETCKLNDVDPYAYLANTLTRIVDGHPASAIDELLPWAYAKVQPLQDAA